MAIVCVCTARHVVTYQLRLRNYEIYVTQKYRESRINRECSFENTERLLSFVTLHVGVNIGANLARAYSASNDLFVHSPRAF